jgi:hypothetical protein
MRVRIDRAVLDEPHQFGRDISAIIDCCERGQHHWMIDDLDAVLGSAWIQGAARWDSSKELAEKTFRAAIDEPSGGVQQRLVVVVAPAPAGATAVAGVLTCSAEDARRILADPLYLVLENATSDWCFVRALVTTFERTRLAHAVDRYWLVPDQAGGSGELVKRARSLIEQGKAAWRIVVLMDSDRLAPGLLPRSVAQRIDALNELGASVITLHKREVENYLPGSLLDSSRTHDAYVSWRSLSREQQDYYDMKYGFARDPATGEAVVDDAHLGLFDSANPWHLKRLIGGFGRAIGEQFTGTQLDRAELATLCATCPGELERLLDTLEELL